MSDWKECDQRNCDVNGITVTTPQPSSDGAELAPLCETTIAGRRFFCSAATPEPRPTQTTEPLRRVTRTAPPHRQPMPNPIMGRGRLHPSRMGESITRPFWRVRGRQNRRLWRFSRSPGQRHGRWLQRRGPVSGNPTAPVGPLVIDENPSGLT